MQSEPTTGTVPIHHQIADSIRARIDSGELAPGDPIPTIRELADTWHCAPGSARSALAVLRSEGRITGGRGKAATVRTPPRRISLSVDWSQEMKHNVLRPRSERKKQGAIELTSGVPIEDTNPTHRYEVVPANDDLAHEFGVEPGTKLQRRTYEITDKDTGIRLAWSVSHIPLALIEHNPKLLDDSEEPWPGGHMHQLYTVGIEVDRFVRSVFAVEPTPGERQRWGIEPGGPLLRVRSRSIDADDRVVEISDATYPADRTEITFTERLRRWPKNYPRFDLEKGDA